MWLAYGGGVLVVIAAVVVIVVKGPAPSSNGKTVVSHHNMATLSPYDAAALIRQHPSISGPAELNDLQFIANQDGSKWRSKPRFPPIETPVAILAGSWPRTSATSME